MGILDELLGGGRKSTGISLIDTKPFLGGIYGAWAHQEYAQPTHAR